MSSQNPITSSADVPTTPSAPNTIHPQRNEQLLVSLPVSLIATPISSMNSHVMRNRETNARSVPYENTRELRIQGVRRNLFPSTSSSPANQPQVETTVRQPIPLSPFPNELNEFVPQDERYYQARQDCMYYLMKLIETRRDIHARGQYNIFGNIRYAFTMMCQIAFYAGGELGDNMILYIESIPVQTFGQFLRSMQRRERLHSVAYNYLNEAYYSTVHCRLDDTLMGALAALVHGLKLAEAGHTSIHAWLQRDYEVAVCQLVEYFGDRQLLSFFHQRNRLTTTASEFNRAVTFYNMMRRNVQAPMPNRVPMHTTETTINTPSVAVPQQNRGPMLTSETSSTSSAAVPQMSARVEMANPPATAAVVVTPNDNNDAPLSPFPYELDDYESDTDDEFDLVNTGTNSLVQLLKNCGEAIHDLPNISIADACGYVYGKMFLSKQTLESTPSDSKKISVCGICKTSGVDTVLDCGHMFCRPCLQGWFKQQPSSLKRRYFVKCCHCRHELFNFCKPIYDC